MTLADFLTEASLNASDFATQLGCETSTVTRILRGERKPSLELALRIERVSEGKVKPNDFMNEAAA